MAARGGNTFAPGGQRGAHELQLALGVKRGRKHKAGSVNTASSATEPNKMGHDVGSASTADGATKPSDNNNKKVEEHTKVLRFRPVHETYEIVDCGVDDYTFDNVWEDGTPKVSMRKHRRVHGTIKRCSLVTAIEAHYRAMAFAFGTMPSN